MLEHHIIPSSTDINSTITYIIILIHGYVHRTKKIKQYVVVMARSFEVTPRNLNHELDMIYPLVNIQQIWKITMRFLWDNFPFPFFHFGARKGQCLCCHMQHSLINIQKTRLSPLVVRHPRLAMYKRTGFCSSVDPAQQVVRQNHWLDCKLPGGSSQRL